MVGRMCSFLQCGTGIFIIIIIIIIIALVVVGMMIDSAHSFFVVLFNLVSINQTESSTLPVSFFVSFSF